MQSERREVNIITPSLLQGKHFGYVLSNGVKCVIVQDPNARVPAAAMNIRAGQLNDPEVLPGLAHFCEHMLFMGTEKYPMEDEYSNYITKNGGYCNAWTADRGTTYYFTVAQEALVGALERFVEFFVAPSFDASSISREVKAVHSEDEKNHSVDFWRLDELWRSLYDPQHPRSRYGNGNMTTLWNEPIKKQVDIRGQLLKFFSAHYVSGAACIVVYSPLPPESVLSVIEGPLLRMRVGEPQPFRFLAPDKPILRNTTEGGLWLNVRTVKKSRGIFMLWPVKSPASLWRSRPGAYVSHILGHECDSSVLGVLRKQGLATGMSVGPRRIDDDNEFLCVDIALTIAGVQHVADVIDTVYQGIGQTAHVDADVFAHMKLEEKLSFESFDITSYADHCVELAYSANETDLEHCWVGGNKILMDDIAATESYIGQLTPDKGIIAFAWGEMPCSDEVTETSPADDLQVEEEGEEEEEDGEEEQRSSIIFQTLPDFAQVPCNCTTRFHKANFSLCRVPEELLRRWRTSLREPTNAELALPAPNPYIATEFAIYREETTDSGAKVAVETYKTNYGITLVRKNVWHYQTFKAAIIWNTLSPCAYATAKNRFYARVMRGILRDNLAELSYFGLLAALENSVDLTPGGLSLSVTGPQQRIVEFFFALFERFFTQEVLRGTVEKYSNYAEGAMRHLASNASNQPYELVNEKFLKAARAVTYTADEVLAAAASASYEEYQRFVEEYLRAGLRYECFVTGNVPSASYVREHLVSSIEAVLSKMHVPPASPESITRFRDVYAFIRDAAAGGASAVEVMSYPPSNPTNPNVAVLFDIFIGEETPSVRALCDCVNKLLSSSFFNELRTKETLGYVVFSRSYRLEGTAHLQFAVQSAVEGADALYLFSRIIAFLSAAEENLTALCGQADVQAVVKGLIEARKKLPDSVSSDCADLLACYLHPSGLRRKEEEIAALEQLGPQEVKKFFHTHVSNSSPSRRGLLVVVNSAASAATDVFSAGVTEVVLPPKLRCEAPMQPEENKAVVGCTLNLPDFMAAPVSVAVKRYTSPEAFPAGLPVVRSTTL
uniref:Uncharacterized protein TCIL3000_8_7090 n=1 Tax=Trypanosoma congolense (strain IL3000) TaxID=1068625 RepID=G0USW8_TRYCI|nr:unnamed protein product [Trypanosoma congolense IL3000]